MTRILSILTVATMLYSTGCAVHGRVHVRIPGPPRVVVETDAPPPETPPPPPAQPADAPPPPPSLAIRANLPELASGVITIETSCTPGAPERLNGIDDNCNGQVDEGFVQSGAVQITLGWTTGADIDLYVTDPFGEVLSYRTTNVNSGGSLDRDARGACTDGQTTENVFWPTGAAPRGSYRIAAHYFSACQAAGPTQVVLSVMVGGQPLGVYQYTLNAGQRIDLATFVIP